MQEIQSSKFNLLDFLKINNENALLLNALFLALGIILNIFYKIKLDIYLFLLILILIISLYNIITNYYVKKYIIFFLTINIGIYIASISKYNNLKIINQFIPNIQLSGQIDKILLKNNKHYIIFINNDLNKIICSKIKFQINKDVLENFLTGDEVIIESTINKFIKNNQIKNKIIFYNKHQGICAQGKINNITLVNKTQKKIHHIIENLRLKTYNQIKNINNKSGGGILISLLIGDTSLINPKDLNSIRKSGIAHILAISGLHMAIISSLILISIRKILCFLFPIFSLKYNIKKYATFITVAFTYIYLLMSSGAISASRSFLMLSLASLFSLLDRSINGIKLLSIAFISLLLYNPLNLFHPSFQLSFIAVFSLITTYRKINDWMIYKIKNRNLLIKFLQIEISSIAVVFTTSFFEIYHFDQYAIIGILANPIIIPIVEFVMLPIGFLGFLFQFCVLGNILYLISSKIGDFVVILSNKFIQIPYSYIDIHFINNKELFFITIAIIIVFYSKTKFKFIGYAIFILLMLSFLTFIHT